MNLADLRTEVLGHGFGPVQFPVARLNQFLNEGYGIVNRRVGFYAAESTQSLRTAAGTATYPWPPDLVRLRSLKDSDRNLLLQPVLVDDLDRSNPTTQGAPYCYALQGPNVRLYPTPDAAYNLSVRYWRSPPQLVADSDVPWFPPDWHSLLVFYALKRCYAGDDDMPQAQYWTGEFNNMLSQFAADVKFPSTDQVHVVRGMWEQDSQAGVQGWGAYWGS
jgi:hypothetical protein